MKKSISLLGVLLISGSIYACSSKKSDYTIPVIPSSGGAMGTAGGAAGASGGTPAMGGGGAAGTVGGSSGNAAGGAMSAMPDANGMCPRRSLKHPDDMLCYCQPASLTMCPDGCVDPTQDPDHCGNCTTMCEATAECVDGQCGLTPTTVVAAATGCEAIHLTVAGGVLYWTDKAHGTVMSQPAAGGMPTTIATGQMAPTTIQVNGTQVYWLNTGSNEIMSAPIGGGAATVVVGVSASADAGADAGAPSTIGGFTIARGTILYYSTGVTIYKMGLTPGLPKQEVGHEDSGIPKALAVEGDYIGYPADINGDVDIMNMIDFDPSVCASDDSITATNHLCVRVGRSQGSLNLENVFMVNEVLYWANQGQILSSSVTMPTGVYDTVATGSPDASKVTAFTVHDMTVYFADDTGVLFKAPLMVNATTTKMARAQIDTTTLAGVSSMVADGSNLYWASPACEILSLPTQ